MSWTSQDSQRGFETTDDLSAQLRTAEERIRELEAKVRLLEDRADRAERWVYKIWVEIEQKFFGGDAVRFSEPPYTQAESGHRSFRIGPPLATHHLEGFELALRLRPTREDPNAIGLKATGGKKSLIYWGSNCVRPDCVVEFAAVPKQAWSECDE